MAFKEDTPKDFNDTLITRATIGTAYVISANEYNSLPAGLKNKYYPLFRRADTTYRLYPQFMSARRDINPQTQVVALVPFKPTAQSVQTERNMPITIQRNVLPINTSVSMVDTDLARKSYNQVLQETKITLNNRLVVTTQYSRY